MATPHFVAKKVGDQYVLVPKNPPATQDGAILLLAGALAMVGGAVRRGPCGLILSMLGVSLLYRGAAGRRLGDVLMGTRPPDAVQSGGSRQSPTFQNDLRPSTQRPEDGVDEASMESFPASDPPARNPLTAY